MRRLYLTLAAALLAGAATAQQPGAPAAPSQSRTPANPAVLDPRDPLDGLLMRWEQAMKGVQTLEAQCVRTTQELTGFKRSDEFVGIARYAKPNLAMMQLQDRADQNRFERFISTGTYLYEFRPTQKLIVVHKLPPPKPGQVGDDSFLSFMFGMRAEEAKRRYDLKLSKEDKDYFYLEVLPRSEQDQREFSRAQLVLDKKTLMPAQLWFVQPNKATITWRLPVVKTGVQLDRKEFEQPALPKDWKMVMEAAPTGDVPPSKVRSKDQP
jgi:TIGR03009 family protein